MSATDDIEDPRRRLLVQALATGLIGGLAGVLPAQRAEAWNLFGDRPEPLSEGRSVYRIKGSAQVNGQAADENTPVRPGDRVETGPGSEMILAVGGQAMILREDTRLAIEGKAGDADSKVITGLRLLSGKLLSVSRDQQQTLTTSTATIGIRGTGWYAEVDPEQTYFCTCYGMTDIESTRDPSSNAIVEARHHDRPLYILANRGEGRNVIDAPFINHTDQELALIEALVGREPPFVFANDAYDRPRRDY